MSRILRIDTGPDAIAPHKVVEYSLTDPDAIARLVAEEDAKVKADPLARFLNDPRVMEAARARVRKAYDDYPHAEGLAAGLGDLGLGAATQIFIVSARLAPAIVATIVFAEQTFAIAAIAASDFLLMNPFATGGAVGACSVRPTAGNAVVGYVNPTAGGLTPATGTYAFLAVRG